MLLRDGSPKGITIHRVAEELDSGELLLRQEVLPAAEDSVFTYHARCVAQAARAAATLISAGTAPAPRLSAPGERPSFGGLPAPADIRELRAGGRRLFRLRDIAAFRDRASGLGPPLPGQK
jgi:hypothetical protein